MAANLRDPGSIPGGDPKRFQDSSNYVFYIVGECFSSAAGTHLATDLTCTELKETAQELQMLSTVTLFVICQVTIIVMNSGFQFSEL